VLAAQLYIDISIGYRVYNVHVLYCRYRNV